jgi:hypothetical protein
MPETAWIDALLHQLQQVPWLLLADQDTVAAVLAAQANKGSQKEQLVCNECVLT